MLSGQGIYGLRDDSPPERHAVEEVLARAVVAVG
jgi:hypothetical protein